jgi:hypothetical protein
VFPIKIKVDGKIKNLKNRKYCLKCSPFGLHNTKKLPQDNSPRQKSILRNKPINCSICDKICNRNICGPCKTKIRRHRCKTAAVNLLGGKCVRCGWAGNIAAFEFHHTDPNKKDFQIGSAANKNWDVVKKEVLKCELLCSNCHRIEHSNRNGEKFLSIAAQYNGRLLK